MIDRQARYLAQRRKERWRRGGERRRRANEKNGEEKYAPGYVGKVHPGLEKALSRG